MKSKILLPLILFLNLTAFSQTLTVLNKDTVICFSIPRAKYLAKEHYRANELAQMDSLNKDEIRYKDAQIKYYIKNKQKLEDVIKNQTTIVALREEEVEKLKKEIDLHLKEIKKQKTQKLVILGLGIVATSYFAITGR